MIWSTPVSKHPPPPPIYLLNSVPFWVKNKMYYDMIHSCLKTSPPPPIYLLNSLPGEYFWREGGASEKIKRLEVKHIPLINHRQFCFSKPSTKKQYLNWRFLFFFFPLFFVLQLWGAFAAESASTLICLIDSLGWMRHVRNRISHRNSHSIFAYTSHWTRNNSNAIFDFMQMRNEMRNENAIAFDHISMEGPRYRISRPFLRIRQIVQTEFDFEFRAKSNLVFKLPNSCEKLNETFSKSSNHLEIWLFP